LSPIAEHGGLSSVMGSIYYVSLPDDVAALIKRAAKERV